LNEQELKRRYHERLSDWSESGAVKINRDGKLPGPFDEPLRGVIVDAAGWSPCGSAAVRVADAEPVRRARGSASGLEPQVSWMREHVATDADNRTRVATKARYRPLDRATGFKSQEHSVAVRTAAVCLRGRRMSRHQRAHGLSPGHPGWLASHSILLGALPGCVACAAPWP